MNFKILLIDDDETQRKICSDSIDSFNKKFGYGLQLIEAKSRIEGLAKLEERTHDAAIVDLRLEPTDMLGQGNEIIREIKKNLRIPLRVVSGHLGDLEEDLREESYFYQCSDRDSVDYENMLSDFVSIHKTGITNILNNKGQIESHITNIFWKHISTILPIFIRQKNEQADWDIEKVLLRYISLHIQEYLELSIDNNLEPFHSIEYYIKPPIKDKLFTGDILRRSDDSFWIVLTPACDLATDAKRTEPKATFITVGCVEKYETVKNGKNIGQMTQLDRNNGDLKYHFLPNTKLFDGGFINFQILLSVPTEKLKDDFDVELVVSSPFRKDIISRFSAYYARQGQPVFSE